MADKTGIEWTDATWNPIAGCSIVSPACTNCYAMAMAARLTRMIRGSRSYYEGLTQPSNAGPVWTGKVVQAPEHILTQPLRWKKPRRIFVNSMSDLFHDGVDDWKIVEIYGLMIAAHHLRGHTFQWLTKRSARARKLLNDAGFWEEVNDVAGQEILDRCDPLNRRQGDARATCDDYSAKNPPPGIWAGVTAEDQTRADERIPDLLATPAATRFISIEPMLGPVDLMNIKWPDGSTFDALDGWRGGWRGDSVLPRLDWVICGGESGPRARPMHPQWVRDLRNQCAATEIPFFFKQWGEWLGLSADRTGAGGPISKWSDAVMLIGDETFYRVGKRRAGSLLDGVAHKSFPQ